MARQAEEMKDGERSKNSGANLALEQQKIMQRIIKTVGDIGEENNEKRKRINNYIECRAEHFRMLDRRDAGGFLLKDLNEWGIDRSIGALADDELLLLRLSEQDKESSKLRLGVSTVRSIFDEVAIPPTTRQELCNKFRWACKKTSKYTEANVDLLTANLKKVRHDLYATVVRNQRREELLHENNRLLSARVTQLEENEKKSKQRIYALEMEIKTHEDADFRGKCVVLQDEKKAADVELEELRRTTRALERESQALMRQVAAQKQTLLPREDMLLAVRSRSDSPQRNQHLSGDDAGNSIHNPKAMVKDEVAAYTNRVQSYHGRENRKIFGRDYKDRDQQELKTPRAGSPQNISAVNDSCREEIEKTMSRKTIAKVESCVRYRIQQTSAPELHLPLQSPQLSFRAHQLNSSRYSQNSRAQMFRGSSSPSMIHAYTEESEEGKRKQRAKAKGRSRGGRGRRGRRGRKGGRGSNGSMGSRGAVTVSVAPLALSSVCILKAATDMYSKQWLKMSNFR